MNVHSRTPLHDAVRTGSEDTVRRLIDAGADVNAVDEDGRTPLHDAARTSSGYTIRKLIDAGADVNAVDKDGRTPLHDAASPLELALNTLFVGLPVKAPTSMQ